MNCTLSFGSIENEAANKQSHPPRGRPEEDSSAKYYKDLSNEADEAGISQISQSLGPWKDSQKGRRAPSQGRWVRKLLRLSEALRSSAEVLCPNFSRFRTGAS